MVATNGFYLFFNYMEMEWTIVKTLATHDIFMGYQNIDEKTLK